MEVIIIMIAVFLLISLSKAGGSKKKNAQQTKRSVVSPGTKAYQSVPAEKKQHIYQKPQCAAPPVRHAQGTGTQTGNTQMTGQETAKPQAKELQVQNNADAAEKMYNEFSYMDLKTSERMKRVEDLMAAGYTVSLTYERDFVAEGLDMLSRYDIQ